MNFSNVTNPTPLCKNLWTIILIKLHPKDIIVFVLQVNKELKHFLGSKLDWTNYFIKKWYPEFHRISLIWWSNLYVEHNYPEYTKIMATKHPFAKFWRLVREEHECEFGMPEYGTCDNPEQLAVKFPKYGGVVHFMKVHRDRVNELRSGWRWHKWGAYFGDHKIDQIEYLNEANGEDGRPLINLQYVFYRHKICGITYKYLNGSCQRVDK